MRTTSNIGKLLLGLSLCFCLVLMDSCKKGDVGPIGPQGTEGRDGTDGAQGSKGDTGARGATGTAGGKGDKGATGASGADGPRGATGATGATGAKGDKGVPGNANVNYTAWKQYTGWSYQAAGTNENTTGSESFGTIVAKSISISGMDESSAAFVYVKTPSSNAGKSIPDEFWFSGPGNSGNITLRYNIQGSWLTIYAVLTEGTWDGPYMRDVYMPKLSWRIVVVKGSNQLSASSSGSVDFSNYQAVQRAFSIND